MGRAVIDAKHHAYQDKSESEKVEPPTRKKWVRSVRDTQTPELPMRESDIRWMRNLMVKQGQKDHNPVARLGEKLEQHPKVMYCEQRAFNQICKTARIKK